MFDSLCGGPKATTQANGFFLLYTGSRTNVIEKSEGSNSRVIKLRLLSESVSFRSCSEVRQSKHQPVALASLPFPSYMYNWGR